MSGMIFNRKLRRRKRAKMRNYYRQNTKTKLEFSHFTSIPDEIILIHRKNPLIALNHKIYTTLLVQFHFLKINKIFIQFKIFMKIVRQKKCFGLKNVQKNQNFQIFIIKVVKYGI